MNGIVTTINPVRGFAAIETDNGLTVIEILEVSCLLSIGDEITGNLESLGTTILKNITQQELFRVCVQDCHCSFEIAMSLLA